MIHCFKGCNVISRWNFKSSAFPETTFPKNIKNGLISHIVVVVNVFVVIIVVVFVVVFAPLWMKAVSLSAHFKIRVGSTAKFCYSKHSDISIG